MFMCICVSYHKALLSVNRTYDANLEEADGQRVLLQESAERPTAEQLEAIRLYVQCLYVYQYNSIA